MSDPAPIGQEAWNELAALGDRIVAEQLGPIILAEVQRRRRTAVPLAVGLGALGCTVGVMKACAPDGEHPVLEAMLVAYVRGFCRGSAEPLNEDGSPYKGSGPATGPGAPSSPAASQTTEAPARPRGPPTVEGVAWIAEQADREAMLPLMEGMHRILADAPLPVQGSALVNLLGIHLVHAVAPAHQVRMAKAMPGILLAVMDGVWDDNPARRPPEMQGAAGHG